MEEKVSMANTTKIGTFLGWGKEGIFGFKTEERQGTKLVNSVWCKIIIKIYKLRWEKVTFAVALQNFYLRPSHGKQFHART